MRGATGLLLAGCALILQGCALAALPIPLAAAGVIGKTRIDAAKRARKAEAEVDRKGGLGGPFVPAPSARPSVVQVPAANFVPPIGTRPTPGTLPGFIPVAPATGAEFVHYALAQAQKRAAGGELRSSILEKNVSLIDPKAVNCGDKPLAVLIDLDPVAGQGIPALPSAVMLADLRRAGIGVLWISDRPPETFVPLRAGSQPVMSMVDALYAGPSEFRKQERRWAIAEQRCIVATLGDRDGDFDELYDFLRNRDYAVRLEMFRDRGWFLQPATTP